MERANDAIRKEMEAVGKVLSEQAATRKTLDGIREALGSRAVHEGLFSDEEDRPVTNEELVDVVRGLVLELEQVEEQVEHVRGEVDALGEMDFMGANICTRCREELREFGECDCDDVPNADQVGYVTPAEQAIRHIEELDDEVWARSLEVKLAKHWGTELVNQLGTAALQREVAQEAQRSLEGDALAMQAELERLIAIATETEAIRAESIESERLPAIMSAMQLRVLREVPEPRVRTAVLGELVALYPPALDGLTAEQIEALRGKAGRLSKELALEVLHDETCGACAFYDEHGASQDEDRCNAVNKLLGPTEELGLHRPTWCPLDAGDVRVRLIRDGEP